MKLAEGLLLRKQLQEKVDVVRTVKAADVYETRVQRVKVSDGIDEVKAQIPKLKLSEVTSEFDWYSKRLRLIDAAIQQANWTTELEVNSTVTEDYKSVD